MVMAQLPDIQNGPANATPEVSTAFLNGVNEKIREEYAHKQLSTLHIPRQVVAKVDGDMANFVLSVDEQGNGSATHAGWLEAYAHGNERAGAARLLAELSAGEIRSKEIG
jgi:hypothetical protein